MKGGWPGFTSEWRPSTKAYAEAHSCLQKSKCSMFSHTQNPLNSSLCLCQRLCWGESSCWVGLLCFQLLCAAVARRKHAISTWSLKVIGGCSRLQPGNTLLMSGLYNETASFLRTKPAFFCLRGFRKKRKPSTFASERLASLSSTECVVLHKKGIKSVICYIAKKWIKHFLSSTALHFIVALTFFSAYPEATSS